MCHNLLHTAQLVGHQDLLKDALRDDAPEVYVSHFLHGPVTGRPAIFVARPLRSPSGAKIGVIYVSIDLNAFSELTDQIAHQSERVMTVIEPDTGIVLARSAASGLELGGKFPDADLLHAMRASPDGGHVVGNLHGRREIFGYAPLPGAETSGAMVAVGIPRSIVLGSVNHQSLVSLGFALAAIAVAFGTAWALGNVSLVRPTKQLADVAERIGEGNLTTRAALAPWQAPEFRRLGDTLDQMAHRLQRTSQDSKRARRATSCSPKTPPISSPTSIARADAPTLHPPADRSSATNPLNF